MCGGKPSWLVEEVIILKSSGFKRLDAEAARAKSLGAGAGSGILVYDLSWTISDVCT